MYFLKLLLIFAFYMLSIRDTLQNWRQRMKVKGSKKIYQAKRSILKKINSEYLLEGLMLKLQYFGHLMRRANSLEETPMEKQTEGRRRGDDRRQAGWMASPTQWTQVWENSRRWWRTGKPGERSPWGCRESDMTKWLNNNNANGKEKNAEVAILVSEEVYFKTKECNKRQKKKVITEG